MRKRGPFAADLFFIFLSGCFPGRGDLGPVNSHFFMLKFTGQKKGHSMKSTVFHRKPAPPGTPPGTLTAREGAHPPIVRVMAFDKDELVEATVGSVEEIRPFLKRWPVCWVDIDGLADTALIAALGDLFSLHPLALEDVVNTHQRSKVEDYDTNIFMVTRMVTPRADVLDLEQVSLFLGRSFVLSFQERPGDCFDPVRERIRKGGRRLRLSQPDYLAYALLDALVDSYFPLLKTYGDRIDELEDVVMDADFQDNMMASIHETRRTLHGLRHVIWPLRDALGMLQLENDLIRDETRIFIRDCQDHVMQQLDVLENFSERASALTDLHLSVMSMRMNEIMKVLTIIATIFMPLTFIVGVYGMNFDNMPELHSPYGYPLLMGIMGLIAAAMMFFFHWMGWISFKRGKDGE